MKVERKGRRDVQGTPRSSVWVEYKTGVKELGAALGKQAEANARTCVCMCGRCAGQRGAEVHL